MACSFLSLATQYFVTGTEWIKLGPFSMSNKNNVENKFKCLDGNGSLDCQIQCKPVL